jgi:hypothetical protein
MAVLNRLEWFAVEGHGEFPNSLWNTMINFEVTIAMPTAW